MKREKILKILFKYGISQYNWRDEIADEIMASHPEAVVMPSDKKIENGINALAKLHAKQSVGDWATGYLTGAKYVKSQLKQGYPEEFLIWLIDEQEVFKGDLVEEYIIIASSGTFETIDDIYRLWQELTKT